MAASGAHACRAAADDLNTALGGDLKLTDFGPRLPQLLRDAELGHFRARRGRGEVVHTVTISWLSSRSGDDPLHSIFCRCAVMRAKRIRLRSRPKTLALRNCRKASQKATAEQTDKQRGNWEGSRGRLAHPGTIGNHSEHEAYLLPCARLYSCNTLRPMPYYPRTVEWNG
eukprot:scaffold90712_cov63-Phaeocystis_antarctica.AAC.1